MTTSNSARIYTSLTDAAAIWAERMASRLSTERLHPGMVGEIIPEAWATSVGISSPAIHGHVIHRDASIGEHGLEVAIADRELHTPAHGPEDHLGREAEARKCSG